MCDWSRVQGLAPPVLLELEVLDEVVVPDELDELVVTPPSLKSRCSAAHAETSAVAIASGAHRGSGLPIRFVVMELSFTAGRAADRGTRPRVDTLSAAIVPRVVSGHRPAAGRRWR